MFSKQILIVSCLLSISCLPNILVALDSHAIELASSNEDFGLKLMKVLASNAKAGENVFISPYSINTALSMLMAGAPQGETLREIYNVLGHKDSKMSKRDILETHQSLYRSLNSESKNTSNNILSVANSIVLQKDAVVLENFLNNLTTYFHSQLFLEDFLKNPEKAKSDVNNWVAEKTNHKIEKLLDHVDSSTQMILMNAIYFKGTWHYQFNKSRTVQAIFHDDLRNLASPKSFMHVAEHFNWASFGDGQMIELPYKDHKLSMIIYLPHQRTSDLTAFMNMFSSETLRQRINEMQNTTVIFSMPKFTMKKSYSLTEQLQTLGIRAAFDERADFSLIDGEKDLSVSDVIHKTYIEVNEEGSEAAAVTGVVITRNIPNPTKNVYMTVDHPFMFFIRDNQQELTLFSGLVIDP